MAKGSRNDGRPSEEPWVVLTMDLRKTHLVPWPLSFSLQGKVESLADPLSKPGPFMSKRTCSFSTCVATYDYMRAWAAFPYSEPSRKLTRL